MSDMNNIEAKKKRKKRKDKGDEMKPRVLVPFNTGTRVHKNKKKPHRRDYNIDRDASESRMDAWKSLPEDVKKVVDWQDFKRVLGRAGGDLEEAKKMAKAIAKKKAKKSSTTRMETLPGLSQMQVNQHIEGIINARKEMDEIRKKNPAIISRLESLQAAEKKSLNALKIGGKQIDKAGKIMIETEKGFLKFQLYLQKKRPGIMQLIGEPTDDITDPDFGEKRGAYIKMFEEHGREIQELAREYFFKAMDMTTHVSPVVTKVEVLAKSGKQASLRDDAISVSMWLSGKMTNFAKKHFKIPFNKWVKGLFDRNKKLEDASNRLQNAIDSMIREMDAFDKNAKFASKSMDVNKEKTMDVKQELIKIAKDISGFEVVALSVPRKVGGYKLARASDREQLEIDERFGGGSNPEGINKVARIAYKWVKTSRQANGPDVVYVVEKRSSMYFDLDRAPWKSGQADRVYIEQEGGKSFRMPSPFRSTKDAVSWVVQQMDQVSRPSGYTIYSSHASGNKVSVVVSGPDGMETHSYSVKGVFVNPEASSEKERPDFGSDRGNNQRNVDSTSVSFFADTVWYGEDDQGVGLVNNYLQSIHVVAVLHPQRGTVEFTENSSEGFSQEYID